MQICVGSSFGVFSMENGAGANLCRVFVWGVFWGEPSRCKFVQGLRLVCFLWKTWQVQICVGSSFGAFSGENLAGAKIWRVACAKASHSTCLLTSQIN